MTDYALRLKKERERRLRMRSVVNLGISGQSGKRWAVTHSFLGVVLDRGSFSRQEIFQRQQPGATIQKGDRIGGSGGEGENRE